MSAGREITVSRVSDLYLTQARRSFATRRVPVEAMRTIISGAVRPRSGDILLARISRLGNHKNLELPTGRRSGLHVGDLIIVAFADRYATDQFESYVPLTLGPTQLVASGGIASEVMSRSSLVRQATDIEPVGLLGNERGEALNVADFALPELPRPMTRPRTIAVLGTSMNAGKTTTIHHLVHGLARMGARPGVTKVTGTGSGNDYWQMFDAGAHRMIDFTDAGLASTFMQPIPRLVDAMTQLVWNLTASGCGINFVEVADGVFQQETSTLLQSESFADIADAVVLAASDAMGAHTGVNFLRERGLPIVAVSGSMTRSSLAAREAARAVNLPIWGLAELGNPEIVAPVLGIDLAEFTPPDAELLAWLPPSEALATIPAPTTVPAPVGAAAAAPRAVATA